MNSLFITTIKYNNKKFYLLNNNIILKPSYDENEILNIKHSAADEFDFKINRLQLLNAKRKNVELHSSHLQLSSATINTFVTPNCVLISDHGFSV